jgi:hypothetical protein
MIDYTKAIHAIDEARSACGQLEDALGWISQAEEEEGDVDYTHALFEISNAQSDFESATSAAASAVEDVVQELPV